MKTFILSYVEALPNIDLDEVPLKDMTDISKRKIVKDRSYSGFNILSEDTLKLFSVISKAEYMINGFSNKDIRVKIFFDGEDKSNINRMTRMFAKLRAFKIIKKVNKKNKYYLTNKGKKYYKHTFIHA